jgi:hypothetical protein
MNVWDQARMGGTTGNRYGLGFWDPRHKMASLAWLPPVSQRRLIYGKKRYVFCINFGSLAGLALGQATLNARVTITSDFWWTDTMYSSPVAGGQTFQLYDSQNKVRYMNVPLFDINLAGYSATFSNIGNLTTPTKANMPYFERRIWKIPAGSIILARLQNNFTTASTDSPQLVLGGYID